MRWVILSLGWWLFNAHSAHADQSASDLIKKGESTIRGQSTQAVMEMTIHRPDFTRSLKLRSWTRGSQRALVEILEPKKEEGIVSLRRESEMWNYLPKVDQTVRVPASMMLQSWMGSDFTNDDLMKLSSLSKDYHHKILEKEKKDGNEITVIECTPQKNAKVVWGKIIHSVRSSDGLPVLQKFYDQKGKWVRSVEYSDFKKMDDRVIPTSLEVKVASPKGYRTTVSYSKVLYDRKIEENIFNQNTLRQTSQKGKVLTAGWLLAPMTGN